MDSARNQKDSDGQTLTGATKRGEIRQMRRALHTVSATAFLPSPLRPASVCPAFRQLLGEALEGGHRRMLPGGVRVVRGQAGALCGLVSG